MATNDNTSRPRYYALFMQDIYTMLDEHKQENPDDFPAMMAFNTAVDLVDGMFKGAGSVERIRDIYDHFIAAMLSNAEYEAQDESMVSAADAYKQIAEAAKLAKEGK